MRDPKALHAPTTHNYRIGVAIGCVALLRRLLHTLVERDT